jgi:hypothetical protein
VRRPRVIKRGLQLLLEEWDGSFNRVTVQGLRYSRTAAPCVQFAYDDGLVHETTVAYLVNNAYAFEARA